MSDKKTSEPGTKKGKFGKIVVGMLALTGSAGGGAAAYLTFAGDHGSKEARDQGPQFVRKGDEDPYAPPVKEGAEEAAPDIHGEGGNPYRTAYFRFPEEFTSNLKDSDALVQLSIAVSTRRDGRVLTWVQKHQLAIRSRILVELADTPEEEVQSVDGKKRLQKRLTDGVNQVLTDAEGFGGVDKVLFLAFIVQ